jgi:CMP-N,N'-diacetyllegionaminic acid synthase
VDHSPLWCNTLPEDLSLSNFINKDIAKQPRQKLDKYYRINGAVYVFKTSYFNISSGIYDLNCYAYIMDKKDSVDIDDEFDFYYAETLLKMAEHKRR